MTQPDSDLTRETVTPLEGGNAPVPAEAGRLGRLIHAGSYVFAGGIVIAAVMLLMEVFLRYVLNRPTIWAHETSTFLCALAFLYGGLFCVSRDSHIRVVLIYDALSPRFRRIFDVVISIASTIACAFFAYAAWLMASKAIWTPAGDMRVERSGSAWNPPLPALLKIALFVMLVVMCIQFGIFVINYLKKFRKGSA